MSGGIFFVMIQAYLFLRFTFRDMRKLHIEVPQGIQELREEIVDWERAASMLSTSSSDECIVLDRLQSKIKKLQRQLKKQLSSGSIPTEIFERTLKDLQQKVSSDCNYSHFHDKIQLCSVFFLPLQYPIRDWTLLIKCLVALTFVLVCFFCHSLEYFNRLSLGWTALLGAILLLVLADRKSIESILVHVEWSTLLFFAVLFVLMESLAKLGLIEWIGSQTEDLILAVDEEARLAVAILIILWVSALVSAFVDNIPLTTMMIRIAISLSEKKVLNLPLQPLIWALSFGACLGGEL